MHIVGSSWSPGMLSESAESEPAGASNGLAGGAITFLQKWPEGALRAPGVV